MKWLLWPFRLTAWLTKTVGRLVVGVVGVLFMTIGVGLWVSFDLPQAGVPVLIVGAILAAKAIF